MIHFISSSDACVNHPYCQPRDCVTLLLLLLLHVNVISDGRYLPVTPAPNDVTFFLTVNLALARFFLHSLGPDLFDFVRFLPEGELISKTCAYEVKRYRF